MHLLGSFFYLYGVRVLSGFYVKCDFFEKVAGNLGVDVFVGNCAHYSSNVSMMKFKVAARNWVDRGHQTLIQSFCVQP